MNLNQITLPALDIEASSRFYRSLGLNQIVKSPHYARFESPEGDATFSIHQHDRPGGDTGVVVYFECHHLDQTVDRLAASGLNFEQPPEDTRWLWREARLKDPSGNTICLYHAGENRKYPPWRIDATEQAPEAES